MLRHRRARSRDRIVQPRDLGLRTVGVTDEIAHFANLRFDLVEIARYREFSETNPLLFQQLPRRSLVVKARDDDVRMKLKNIFRAARQNPERFGTFNGKGFEAPTFVSAEAPNLFGGGERNQQLIRAQIHGCDTGQACSRNRYRQQDARCCKYCDRPPSHLDGSGDLSEFLSQGTITASCRYSAR